ncbi:MAG TPA: transposase [Bdellovibrionales bacterium]|nr:transposase [Bdellovibrionales bacterium]
MTSRKPQLKLLKDETKSYGGELLKTRAGRSRPRPLDTKQSMHLVLRSSKAAGVWSFKKKANEIKIKQIATRFTAKYGIKLISLGVVGNHLHFHIKLANRFTYKPFIRALTAAIAMAVTGASRWKPLKKSAKDRFWDYRPFTRVVQGFRAYLNLRDYIHINQLEGFGYERGEARFIVNDAKRRPWRYSSA